MVINLRIKMNEIITYFKNTTNISRTSFDRDKSFQVNIVYRIQIETRVKQYNYVTKKILKNFFLVSRARFLTASQTETIFFPWPYLYAISYNIELRV